MSAEGRSVQILTEKHRVTSGETLSQLVYEKKLPANAQLYGRRGWVNYNMTINPHVHDWRKLPPGTLITVRWPVLVEPERPQQPAPSPNQPTIQRQEQKTPLISAGQSNAWGWDVRIFGGVGAGSRKEIVKGISTASSLLVTAPRLGVDVAFGAKHYEASPFGVALFGDANRHFPVEDIQFAPSYTVGGRFEWRGLAQGPLKFISANVFHEQFDVVSSVGATSSGSSVVFGKREMSLLWIGPSVSLEGPVLGTWSELRILGAYSVASNSSVAGGAETQRLPGWLGSARASIGWTTNFFTALGAKLESLKAGDIDVSQSLGTIDFGYRFR